jgi:hypothetical protein
VGQQERVSVDTTHDRAVPHGPAKRRGKLPLHPSRGTDGWQPTEADVAVAAKLKADKTLALYSGSMFHVPCPMSHVPRLTAVKLRKLVCKHRPTEQAPVGPNTLVGARGEMSALGYRSGLQTAAHGASSDGAEDGRARCSGFFHFAAVFVALASCGFEVKHQVLHVDTKLPQRILNEIENPATTPGALHHPRENRFDEPLVLRREIGQYLSQLNDVGRKIFGLRLENAAHGHLQLLGGVLHSLLEQRTCRHASNAAKICRNSFATNVLEAACV